MKSNNENEVQSATGHSRINRFTREFLVDKVGGLRICRYVGKMRSSFGNGSVQVRHRCRHVWSRRILKKIL